MDLKAYVDRYQGTAKELLQAMQAAEGSSTSGLNSERRALAAVWMMKLGIADADAREIAAHFSSEQCRGPLNTFAMRLDDETRIAALLKASPQLTDLQIAQTLDVDPELVADLRGSERRLPPGTGSLLHPRTWFEKLRRKNEPKRS